MGGGGGGGGGSDNMFVLYLTLQPVIESHTTVS